MGHVQQQLFEEREAEIHFVRHQMVWEQRASLRILESVSQEPDFVRQEAQTFRSRYQRPEQVAQLTRVGVENVSCEAPTPELSRYE